MILAANRDEFYDRPTRAIHFWDDAPEVLAGRDLKKGGTWFGITRSGKLAALTNYRNPSVQKSNSPSRGFLVSDYLKSELSPADYMDKIKKDISAYNGFNLLIGDREELYYLSSQTSSVEALGPGAYGLSNHLLNTQWPKVKTSLNALNETISDERKFLVDELLEAMADRTQPDDRYLPETGVGLEWERILAPVFISSPNYGTRSSTVLLIDHNDHATLVERSFDKQNPDVAVDRTFDLNLEG